MSIRHVLYLRLTVAAIAKIQWDISPHQAYNRCNDILGVYVVYVLLVSCIKYIRQSKRPRCVLLPWLSSSNKTSADWNSMVI